MFLSAIHFFVIQLNTVVSIFDDMQQATPQEVDRLLALSSPQRRDEALRFKHQQGRFACLKSYEMLKAIMVGRQIITENDHLVFRRNEHGKPSLADFPKYHFSISHCREAITVAFGNQPVGVDVESFRTVSDGLLGYTMSEAEIAFINGAASPNQEFALFWTKKEAYYKYLGTGICGDIPNILASADSNLVFQSQLFPEKNFAFTLVTNK